MEDSKSIVSSARVSTKSSRGTRPDSVVTSATTQTGHGWQVNRENEQIPSCVSRNEDKQMLLDHLNFLKITARALEQAVRSV